MASPITGRASDVQTRGAAKSERCEGWAEPRAEVLGVPSSGADELQIFLMEDGIEEDASEGSQEESRGEDMFEDLVIMSTSKAKRPTASGGEGGWEKRASRRGADRRASFG